MRTLIESDTVLCLALSPDRTSDTINRWPSEEDTKVLRVEIDEVEPDGREGSGYEPGGQQTGRKSGLDELGIVYCY